METAGKVLGAATQIWPKYGIVVSVGPIRDGIQRNIEVCSVQSYPVDQYDIPTSLYPSYALMPAVRNTLVLDVDPGGIEIKDLSNACEEVQSLSVDSVLI